MVLQALENDRLGPKKRGLIPKERLQRIAIQEGATALVCCLMPAIEPLTYVRNLDISPLNYLAGITLQGCRDQQPIHSHLGVLHLINLLFCQQSDLTLLLVLTILRC